MLATLPDALADALARVISDVRREMRTEVETIKADHRAAFAELHARYMEREAALKSHADAATGRVNEALARVRDGRDGRDADLDLMREMVTAEVIKAVDARPAPEPGPQGPPGADGRDADVGLMERMIEEKVAALPSAEPGPPGPAGPPGERGEDADPDLIGALIVKHVAETVAALPPAEKGEPGQNAEVDYERLQSAIDATVARAVDQEVVRHIADLPLPALEPGPPGPPGPQGERGADADPEQIAGLVLARMQPAPQGAPGRDGRAIFEIKRIGDELIVVMNDGTTFSAGIVRGEKGDVGERGEKGAPGAAGADGRDADPETIRMLIAEQVATLPAPEPGPPGPQGERGADGRDVDVETVRSLVVDEVAKIPPPADGKDGRDGKDADPLETAAMVDASVAKAVSALPPPQHGEPGAPGPKGERGDPGPEGPAGRNAVDLVKGFIDRGGNCLFTFSDGSIHDVGVIVGRDGADGAPGRDGKDGLSFSDFVLEPEYDGERTVRLKWANGDKAEVREWRLPIPVYREIYREGEQYQAADVVTFGGSVWYALHDTAEKPGNGSAAWRLAVKHGRDGRDGKDGERGPPGRVDPKPK